MELFQDLASFDSAAQTCGLAMGVFDGIHLGHQAVIDAARGFDRLGVLTFEPHPIQVIAPGKAPRRILANLDHKKRILEGLGVDFVIVIQFTPEFAARDAQDFASDLFRAGFSRVTAGEDWSFGKSRGGTMSLLAEWGTKFQTEVVAVSPVKADGERISSTRIRQCLRDENLGAASAMLGRPYSVFGVVVKGQQLGRTIGVPTANLAVAEEQLPPSGVYLIEGNGHRGVANVGSKPTVQAGQRRSCEVHLFCDKIPMSYGWELEVSFLKKMREERNFPNLSALKEQIFKDIELARALPHDDFGNSTTH